MRVVVICANLYAKGSTMAVADTGAQVSTAGHILLNNLDILQHQLQLTPMAINHVTGGGVHLLGRLFVVGPVTTNECIFFADRIQCLYPSLGVRCYVKCRLSSHAPQYLSVL